MIKTFSPYRIVRRLAGRLRKEPPSAPRRNGQSRGLDAGTPVEEARYVVFDTELTGLKPKKDSIVSIGAVTMSGSRIEAGNIYYRLVAPRTELTGRSVVVHGLTPSEVSEWPAIDTLLPEFLDFCRDSVLVGHVVSIDLAFLNIEMKRLLGAPLANPAVDTFGIYQWLRKKENNSCAYYGGEPDQATLYALAKQYDIAVDSAHNALSDAFITAQLFQRFLTMLPRMGVRTVGDLIRVGRP